MKNIQAGVHRRTILNLALIEAGFCAGAPSAFASHRLVVSNVTGLASVTVARIAAPRTAAEVCALLSAWPGQVAVGGGRFSMGGQVAVEGGLHLDMRQMNRLVWIRAADRTVRVQAGMRWRELQDHLDRLGLAVKTMQSFSNFTVGGSVSVNCHGRYVGHGSLANTVRALQIVLADSSVVEASRSENGDLFRAALGGYGAVGVITEVELDVAQNVRIERKVESMALTAYAGFFEREVHSRASAILHNADLLPPAFDTAVSVTWHEAEPETPLTETERLIPRNRSYGLDQNVLWAMTELPAGYALRQVLLHQLNKPAVQWLNHEASLDVAQLEPRTRAFSTYALQEYFIPKRHFLPFAQAMAQTLAHHQVEAVNISVRHSPADRESMLPWAKEEVFCFVLYYKQRVWAAAQEKVGQWTRALVDLALRFEGRYYLPYQLHATKAQFAAAYPEAADLVKVKRRVDPQGRFSNQLWKKYLD